MSVVLLLSIAGNNTSYSQTGFNTTLEYATGTWCQWCPCAETIIHAILQNYPETVVLGYHGPPGSSDPWDGLCGNMISLFGFSAYPTGVVGRKSGIISRDAWNNQVVIQSNTQQPTIEINLAAMNYNSSTRELTATIDFTTLVTPSGEQRVNFILTEDNIIFTQTGNGSCPGSASFTHDNVVKGMINGDMGEVLTFTGDNSTVTKNVSYTIPAEYVAENCRLNIVTWTNGGSMSTSNTVGQSRAIEVDNPTGIHNTGNIVSSYELKQNYPNPFNPTTNIFFSVPKDGNVSLKFYDILGNEVASYIDNGFLKAGTYNAEFDGSKLASGVYFYTLSTNDFTATKKMILTK